MIGAYDCARFIALGPQANDDAEHQILLLHHIHAQPTHQLPSAHA